MGTWQNERDDYGFLARLLGLGVGLDHGRCLGDGRDGRLGSAPATLAPHSTMAPARLDAKTGGMLLRFFAARMQGRKTMMCTMSGELAAFLNSARAFLD